MQIVGEKQELWTVLSKETRPILIYGMGLGAEKIITAMRDKGLSYADVFASNSFVRGHDFLGKRVLRYDEAVEKYGDFVILLAFGVSSEETIGMITELAKKHSLYAPETPVFGDGLFDYAYFEANRSRFEAVRARLADEKSKDVLEAVLNAKITGKIEYLLECATERTEVFESIFSFGENESYLDLGAYDGDTIQEFLQYAGEDYSLITALEPDRRNFKKLKENTALLVQEKLRLFQVGVWDKEETLFFTGRGGRNSNINNEGTHQVKVNSVDNIMAEYPCTYIKMDVEGAESEALLGARDTIKRCLPKLAVSGYHRNEDLFLLVERILEISDEYDIYMRHHPYIPAWETNIYAVVKGQVK